jgi:Fe-S cluster biogenesis protein NfuA/nitrite reductase/ring-hydroxylating ferredoxin subunit
LDDTDVGERVARVEALLGQIESLPDRVAREAAMEMVQALLDLYGEGLARTMAPLDADTRRAVADDELVAHLLLLHDLHPVPVETRVHDALDEVRPYLDSHGGGVELVGVEDGVVRLRMFGSCDGCPSSAMTLKLAIEDAIHKAAPDVVEVEAEGVSAPAAPAGPTLLQLEVSDAVRDGREGPGSARTGAMSSPDPAEGWATAGGLPELSGGGTLVKAVSGDRVLFIAIEDTYYAYRPVCPGCSEELETATLTGAELACASCGQRFDIRRAGRCLDQPELYLEPVPLLVDDTGLVKVALGTRTAA